MAFTPVTQHVLEVIKGWPSPHNLDKQVPLAATVAAETVHPGMVVSQGSDGAAVLGMGLQKVALFVQTGNVADRDMDTVPLGFGSTEQPDVPGIGMAARRFGDTRTWVPTLPCLGDYELQSTEISTALAAGFNCGVTLTSPLTTADAGKLTAAAGYYIDDVCGVTSVAATTGLRNQDGKSIVQFWTLFIPQTVIGYY